MNKKNLPRRNAAKWLFYHGYSVKATAVILKQTVKAVASAVNEKGILSINDLTEEELQRRRIVDIYLDCSGIVTPRFNDNDRIYIQMMRWLGVPREYIQKLYYYVDPHQLKRIIWGRNIPWRNFDESLLGLERDEYMEFLRTIKWVVDNSKSSKLL